MTTYFVTVGLNEYRVEINNNHFLIDGQPFELKLSQLNANGLYLLQEGTRKLEMLLRRQDRNKVAVSVDNREVLVQVEKGNGTKAKAALKAPECELLAPMPGLVIQVNVHEGQAVEKGDVVVVLESMKMQMEVRAPMCGIIEKIGAVPGIKVNKAALLVKFKETLN
jgi:biotin carboxyl carrier protein